MAIQFDNSTVEGSLAILSADPFRPSLPDFFILSLYEDMFLAGVEGIDSTIISRFHALPDLVFNVAGEFIRFGFQPSDELVRLEMVAFGRLAVAAARLALPQAEIHVVLSAATFLAKLLADHDLDQEGELSISQHDLGLHPGELDAYCPQLFNAQSDPPLWYTWLQQQQPAEYPDQSRS